MNPAEQVRAVQEDAAEVYPRMVKALIQWRFEGGEIPGIELPTPGALRKFYEATDEAYWEQLKMTDPAEAISQLSQWSDADKTQVLMTETTAGGVP